jgi:XTP/dITP diphosphohydrolase
MKLRLASGNPHKARELAVLLPGRQLEPLDSQDMPEETGATFYENASAKAHFGRTIADPDAWVLGEDSGLEVDGLGGRPGIRSARYAGPASTDEQNLQRLLEELAGMAGEARRARYVCELVCVSPELVELRGSGTLSGRIAEEPRGAAGFGYDPVFVPEGESRTVAELGDEWKALHSHRARAALALRDAVRASAREG